ncbi:peptidase M48 family protein [Sesbania bispinosa]|nr:peptidase M48 family protein [Sesbania bispinosa]
MSNLKEEKDTFYGGTEQAIADISPTQIHSDNGKSHRQHPTRSSTYDSFQRFRLGPNGPKPRNGQAHEESEGEARDEEARAEFDDVASGP